MEISGLIALIRATEADSSVSSGDLDMADIEDMAADAYWLAALYTDDLENRRRLKKWRETHFSPDLPMSDD